MKAPSIDDMMKEAKRDVSAPDVGMYLVHNGVVRKTPKKQVRDGICENVNVCRMNFSYDGKKVEKAIENTYEMPGIYYIRVWLNEGILDVGDDIMIVVIGGDIRPRIVDALNFLVGTIKSECVIEEEIYEKM